MNKIIKNISDLIKDSYHRYPVTISSILLCTLILIISINDLNDTIGTILLTIVTFGTTTFYIEAKDKKNFLYYLFAFIISLISIPLHNINAINDYGNRIILCYLISIGILGIYTNYKNSNVTVNNYLVNLTINTFKTTFVYGILNIGILSIISIINLLIIEIDSFEIIERSIILITGIYYIPKLICSLNNINEDSKFVKIVIKYVLNSLLLIAFVIIYLYIIKIFIIRKMPNNEVFRIIAILFITGLPIWTMASNFKDNNILDKINNIIPILFIPFIFLQIYSLGIRILDNGITPTRYMGIMLIIFEIIYTIIYLKNKNHIDKIIYVFIIILNISLIVPYINMYKISILSQYHNLKIYTTKKELNIKDKIKINGAYYYLRDTDEELVNKLLNENDINIIKSFNEKKYNYNYDNDYYYADIKNINISGYDKLYEISFYSYDTKELTLSSDNIVIDISSIVNENTLNDRFKNYIKEHSEIIINDKQKLAIKHIYVTYNKYDKEYKNISIEGYILEKD